MGVVGCEVSGEFFATLGVAPLEGRVLQAEDTDGRAQDAVVSHHFWQSRLGADPAAVGKSIHLNGRAFTIIGILPADLVYPLGVELWTPLVLSPQEKSDRVAGSLHVLARLRPDVSFRQAGADMRLLASKLSQLYPNTNRGQQLSLLRLRHEQFEYHAPFLFTLQGAAVFVLLLAWANVANLLLARVLGRRQEAAIRFALGADRLRVTRQHLAEMLLLALPAGVLATLMSFWSVNLIKAAVPLSIAQYISGWNRMHVDGQVLAVTILLTLLAGVMFGVLAAVRASSAPLNLALREGGTKAGESIGRSRLRSLLVVTEVAMALVLLAGAGLVTKGFFRLWNVYQGFDPANLLTMTTTLPQTKYPDDVKLTAFYQRLLGRVRSAAGVKSAALVGNLPANGSDNELTMLTIEGRPALSAAESPTADLQSVSGDFFTIFRISLLQGRSFAESDAGNSPRVVIVSRSAADRFWPGENPIGHRLRLGRPDSNLPWLTVVGVAGDYVQNWYDPPRPTIFVPYLQAPRRSMALAVRAVGEARAVLPAMKSALAELDPTQPLFEVRSMGDVIRDSLSPIRVIGGLMLVFGVLALVFSAVGVYSVLAHSVTQRTHEFGVRIALGATRSNIVKTVLSQALRLSTVGLSVGLPLSLALSYLMASFLYGLITLDLSILGGFASLLALVGLAAGYFPAHRATKVDPMVVALRYE